MLRLTSGYFGIRMLTIRNICVTLGLYDLPIPKSLHGIIRTMMRAAFLYWEINQELLADNTLSLLPDFLNNAGRSRGCDDAVLAVKQAIMFGDTGKANEYSD